MGIRSSLATFSVVTCVALASCSETGSESTLLPSRTAGVDTTAVTDSLRRFGGDVFVGLTGAPDDAALDLLRQAGMTAPMAGVGEDLVTFPSVLPATVWGHVPAGGVGHLASLPFVLMIEPTAGSGGGNLH